jgi:hypothetical protein
VPKPGKFFGHVVTIFSSRLPWAMAGAERVDAAAPATPAAAAPVRKLRRFIDVDLPSMFLDRVELFAMLIADHRFRDRFGYSSKG